MNVFTAERKGFLFLLLGIVFLGTGSMAASAEESTLNVSPVVQLVSYKDSYGKYIEMYGWGSASIINKQGVIISNNHVVDDGKGKLASAFSVCMTKKEKERPVCDYTASLIARNDMMDISILKIDPKDIYGNTVDYTKFKTIDIDYEYVPQTRDETLLIGYPWIGAETITETKGIVSGTSEYNGYKYIKTDATIAGGNSGGAMVSSSGKLIGIPTYSMGGFFESSLGYALSIKEAKDFILENISKIPEEIKSNSRISAYQKLLEEINKNMLVSDDLFSMKFGADYEVKNYVKNKYLDFQTKTMKDVSVALNMELVSLPNLVDEKQYWHYIKELGFYYDGYSILNKKEIGGTTFYTAVNKDDVTGGETNYYTLYFAKLSPKLLLKLEVYAPLYDEKNNQKVKTEVESVLGGLSFKSDSLNAIEKEFTFDLTSPKLKITTTDMSIKNDRYAYYTQYFGNLYEYFTVTLENKDLYNGKGKTAEEIYEVETQNIPQDEKALVTFQGHKGYVTCNSSSIYGNTGGFFYYYYNNYYGYYGSGSGRDENGKTIPATGTCMLKILDGMKDQDGQEYFLLINVTGEKTKLKSRLDETFRYLSKNMVLEPMNDGKTKLINVFNKQVQLLYTDIATQSEEYKKTLKLLVRYGILKNTNNFNPYYPLKWKDAIPLYLKAVYNVDLQKDAKNCEATDKTCWIQNATSTVAGKSINWKDIFVTKMNIDLEAYVPSEAYYNFDRVTLYHLAGVNLSTYSEKEISLFESRRDEKKYKAEYEKMDTFIFDLYGNRTINIGELTEYSYGSFSSDLYVYYNTRLGIEFAKTMNEEPYNFNEINTEWYTLQSEKELAARGDVIQNTFDTCLAKKENMTMCMKNYLVAVAELSKLQENELVYPVLTKANLIDTMLYSIDFGLFDAELAKRKETPIN